MPFDPNYHELEPTREEIDHGSGLLLLEFGADWCGHCQAISSTVKTLTDGRPDIHHLRIADGRGKPLGRSFRVKLWPTFIFLRDGQVASQLVRPGSDELQTAFDELKT